MQVYNFSSGPAVLPRQVLTRVQQELLDWHGSGISVMEFSHRGAEFAEIIERAEQSLRQLLSIPTSYRVLFLQGGGSLQFSQIPMNLLRGRRSIDLVLSGTWSQKAHEVMTQYANVRIAASSEGSGFDRFPDPDHWQCHDDSAYLHLTTNETISGVEFFGRPGRRSIPVVADMSSHLLSRPIEVTDYALIYAGAQKNVGPAGLTLVIIRDDLLGEAAPYVPEMLNYQMLADQGSMINTPPTFAIYVAGLVFDWLLGLGGLEAIETINRNKAAMLYRALDAHDFYIKPVHPDHRSRMNIPFRLADPSRDAAFLAGAKARGLVQLKGHRSTGGMRASIYNAMPVEGVQTLVDYLHDFARQA